MLYKKKKNVSLATGLGRGKLSATALALVTSICTILQIYVSSSHLYESVPQSLC